MVWGAGIGLILGALLAPPVGPDVAYYEVGSSLLGIVIGCALDVYLSWKGRGNQP